MRIEGFQSTTTTTIWAVGQTIPCGYNNASDVTSADVLSSTGAITASRTLAVDVRTSTGTIVASRTLAYDEIGRVRRLIGAGLQETALTYDKADNLSTMTDPRGGLYDYAFDRLDRLVSETDPELGETSISYDQRDNITAVEDAENLSTTFVVNGFGDVIRRTSPDTGVTDYVVDARGRMTSTTDARGVTTGFTYDGLGRVLTKTFPSAPAEDVTYSYDDTTGGNHGVGRLTGFDDASGSTAYHYDALGRMVEVSRTIAGDDFTTEYGYDAAGRVVEMTYPSGRVVTFTRDSTGRVTDVATKANATATPEAVATDVEYLPFHPAGLFADGAAAPGLDMPHLDGLAGFTHGNGLSLLLNYDADGRLTGMSTADGLTEVQDLTLVYDAAADITAITDNLDPTRSQSFDYDGVGRLTWASGAYGEIDYSYDLVGNRTHRTIDDGTITDEVYAYGAGSHRLESVTVGGAPTRDFAYTAAGSTASDSRAGTPLAFAYNFAGRLESVTAASGTLASREYSYDALQHRVREVKEDRVGGGIQASAVSYVYDLDGHLIAEAATLGSTPSVRREYIWLGDTPVGVVDHTMSGDPLLVIHTDHLGRPQKLTDASQAVVWDGQFDPFGEEHAVAGTTDLPLRFPGQEWDAATGLSQNWNRDYDPTLGRYVESDPIGLAGGMSTYSYAVDNPLGLVDPTGELSIAGILPTLVPILMQPEIAAAIITALIIRKWAIDRFGGPLETPTCMETRKRGKRDPVVLPQSVNPGRSENGDCNRCPPDERFWVDRPGHGHANGFWHTLVWRQDPVSCVCYSDRPSRGLLPL